MEKSITKPCMQPSEAGQDYYSDYICDISGNENYELGPCQWKLSSEIVTLL